MIRIHPRSRALFAALAFSTLLSACGGGGSGGGDGGSGQQDLVLNWGYNAGMGARFADYSAMPIVGGLGGHTPHYRLTAGTLPHGLAVDPSTGEIAGVPTEAGQFTNITVTITVDGYSGSLSQTLGIQIQDRFFAYDVPYSLIATYPVDQGGANTPPLTVASGVQETFSVDPSTPLPAGVSIDAATGVLTGTPTTATANNGNAATVAKIDAVLSYDGVTATYVAPITVFVQPFSPILAYPDTSLGDSILAFKINQPISEGAPTMDGSGPQTAVTFDNFVVTPGGPNRWPSALNALPPGLTVDPVTGLLYGTPTVGGEYWTNMTATAHHNGLTGTASGILGIRIYCGVSASVVGC